MRLLPFAVCLTTACAHLRAPEGEMVSDRPDFTESTSIVPVGRVQVEAGATHTRSDSYDTRHWSVGEALLRAGVSRRVEARVTLPTWNDRRHDPPKVILVRTGALRSVVVTERQHGYDDMTVGLKAKLLDPRDGGPRFVPTLAAIVATAVPTASGPFALDAWQPEAKLAADWEVSERVAVGANFNATWPEGETADLDLSTTVGLALGERLGSYVEWFALALNSNASRAQYVNGGLTLAITPYLQLDGRVGRQTNARDAETFVGAGIVVRF